MNIITSPPTIVSRLGCSLITNQTQMGPKWSQEEKTDPLSAGINLGAIVTKTNGITHTKYTLKV